LALLIFSLAGIVSVTGKGTHGNRSTHFHDGITETYFWDFENRLTGLEKPGTGSYSYIYDHRTRRVVRDESGAGGDEAILSFSGGTSVQEWSNSLLVSEQIRGSDWGGGVGGVLYTIRNNQRSYNSYNSRGDVVSASDQTGTATWQASYEAFGRRNQEEGTNAERQRANTKDEDPTGLLNEGFRYRDLETGVFISRDPAGFVDGPNVYTYVRQNPWTKFDPLGLYETDGGTPFESKTIRSNGGKVLGGGMYDNGIVREAHNAAVTGNTAGLESAARMSNNPGLGSELMRITEAGWASGKGDGSYVAKIGEQYEMAGDLYVATLGGEMQRIFGPFLV
jgi:RHS repeat-associated protein